MDIDKELDISLVANNSSGQQKLTLTKSGNEFWFALIGHYKGSYVQIDFEELSRSELEDYKAMIDLILE